MKLLTIYEPDEELWKASVMTFETLLLFSIAFSVAAVVPGPGVLAVVATFELRIKA